MAMADDGGRWCPSRSPSNSPTKRCRFPDDDGSPKRRKLHHRNADSAVDAVAGDEVEEGEVVDGAAAAAMDVDRYSANSRESYRGTRRHSDERSSHHYRRSHRSGSIRGRDESRGRERPSGSSRHDDERRRNSDDKHRHHRVDSATEVRDRASDSSASHRDSSKYRTSHNLVLKDDTEEKGRHKRQRSEEAKENYFKEKGLKEEHEQMVTIEQKIAVQEHAGKVEDENRRTEATVVKSNDQQQQQIKKKQQLESVDGEKIAHPKDDNDNCSIANAEKPPARVGILATTRASANNRDRTAVVISNKVAKRPPPAGILTKSGKVGLQTERNVHPDNWDDADGYYAYRLGELLGDRYEITAAHGTGVFSRVVRAKDLKTGRGDPEKVAIKIIRSNATMYKAGKQEIAILETLTSADREDKHHCVRYISNFRYRNHLCLVLESLHMNLREVLKKFGRNIGLKLTAVRIYAKQIFIALKHLKDCKVLHCDIKPDNILVNQAKNVLKLCDFGNAMLAGKNEVTPYLVSRFYRAPEIILGLPYDHPLDMWSVGCCLYELCTGQVLFPGKSNNEMLRLHMELKGPFPKKMLGKGAFTMQHFNRDLNFQATDKDPVTNKIMRRLIFNIKPKGIGSYISNIPGEDPKTASSFKDLLDKIFALEPAKRLTVEEALFHPFITGK